MKSEQGFVNVLFLSLLPLLFSIGLAVYFTFSFLKTDLSLLNICRSSQLHTHSYIGKDLFQLLHLNPKALNLRLAEQIAQQNLRLAILSENPIGIGLAQARLLHIQNQRGKLAFRQNVLIQKANTSLKMTTPQIETSLRKEFLKQTLPMLPWIKFNLILHPTKTPSLAVKPDGPDLAPAYEPVINFEEEQSWVHSWQLELNIKRLNFKGRFERSCATSLYSEEKTWVSRLKVAKLFSKPLL